jgi:hypothetical protein
MDSLEQQKTRSKPHGKFQIDGGIAQLGERLHGMQEVNGSIPFTSTSFLVALFKSLKVFVPLV